ncbi:putative ATP-dependent RNA helicase PB1A10.06c [Aspergillus awamori]|uniref:RNA helicase n=2 Tax=Aspergillus TaxID=5052 RepID=A0A3F3QDU6_9EURO|nr:P-loop containing nucleoside triphosphate hydrolase protein [Aspergillus welwitschiae]GCB27953.1 putative ATP-dependent RNA helicase PB1A10.06c [Aspergillus awamori]GKZ58401.1 putative ATP-dependent RNA helicase DHR1 [Aspergillus niger]RDH37393.1 P-loop containing nucleoside triphosphate hydrolase protein [Aspergillus welwitschiae]GKZ68421.1 putative ATP-dependent RNA helicase DHR1 [Aspergillus niger]GLA19920.1 putative ATP-dependent RNA helicase DHR1 [Aspergillus niger]
MPKFVPRQRKQKHKQREATTAPVDTNVAELAPVSKDEKEAKRQKLKEELRAQHAQVSSKKQKRLDKYIENKLKKEENLELLKKLAESKVDTSSLQSSRELGKRKRQDEVPAVSRTAEPDSRLDQDLDLSDDDSDDSLPQLKTTVSASKSEAPAQKPAENPAIGIGLKRPLELGPDGFPVLKKRKQVSKKPEITITMPEVPWEGFGSDEDQDEDEKSEEGEDEDSEGTSSDGSSDEGSESDGEEEEDDEDDDEESEEDEDEEDKEEEKHKVGQPRQSAFKSWARQQINDAIGFKPTTVPVVEEQPFIPERKKPVRNTVAEEEPLPLELQVTTGDPNRKAFSVQVNRSEEIQNARLGLPVVGEEQKIMEAIYNNSSIVIWGATGSGKTTQLPQFLFEAGYGNPDSPNPGMIGVTQPRRVAAVSMAKRVGEELGEFSDQVSYQIRFESTASSKTAIKFMTDGILIREIAEDFSLSKYSVIVIDEAHERSVNTDILIGMVSRIVDLRKAMQEEDPSVKPLKLVVMSATLRISDFTQNPNLFRQGPPPLVQAQGRQYPVTIHFSRRTHRDYVEEAFRKVSRGHRKLPPGGMLVFMTGQNEIRQLSKRLKQAFKPTQRGEATQAKVQISANDAPLEAEDLEIGGTDLSLAGNQEDDESDLEITGLDEPEEDEDEFDLGEEAMSSTTRVHVLPLYSQLPTKEQLRVFEPPPEGSRLIVLATNVAETSLTIPGIKYVFDCGRAKEKQYDLATGVQKFQIEWISKASANQRAGRAGRTGPGHCYRLYSSAIYENEFAEYTDPEILRTPIEGVVLQMKSMGLHNVINFPFPTPPSRQGLAKAEKLLKNLGALTSEGQITPIGNRLSTYPLSPRFGKMLYVGHQHGCMPYVIALVSALAVGDLFVPENQIDPVPANKDDNEGKGVYTNSDRLEDTAREQRHKDYARVHRLFSKHDDTSDALKYLSAICAYGYASDGDSFCEKMFLRAKAFKEATQLRRQLTDIVRSNNPGLVQAYQARLPEPTEKQVKAIKQIITAGFIDNVALRADLAPVPPEMHRTPKRAIDVPYFTLMRSRDGPGLELDDKAVYVHPSSVIAQLSAKEMPQYIVYSHLQQSSPSIVSADQTPKIRMYPLATPSGLQLSALAHGTPLIEYGKPIGKTELIEGIPQRRSCWVIPSLVGEAGGSRWPLPAKKVIQRKDAKEGWVIEKFVA